VTYLQIVQSLVSELGLSGVPTLTDVVGNKTIEIQNACRWVHDANLDIDNQWMDWKYHWLKYGPQTAASAAQTVPAPTGGLSAQQWDLNKFRFRTTSVGGPTWAPVEYYERQHFLDLFDPDNAVAGPPVAFTIEPDNTLFFSAPFDQAYDFLGEFWRRPFEIVAATDTPLMPSQYHRMIMCRAAVMYGNREDAPEIIGGLEAEFIQFNDKLEGDQLEGFALRRNSTDRDRRRHHGQLHQFLQ
jgi:hypothetical protein